MGDGRKKIRFFSSFRKSKTGPGLDEMQLKMMIRNISDTLDHEITCDECFEQLDVFAEQVLLGKNPSETIPLVQDHLSKCKDCREEFEALLKALKAHED